MTFHFQPFNHSLHSDNSRAQKHKTIRKLINEDNVVQFGLCYCLLIKFVHITNNYFYYFGKNEIYLYKCTN